jgi:hypothetical protein
MIKAVDESGIDPERFLNGEERFEDSEGNEIHPIFDTDEAGDTPDHCGDCGKFLDTSWHEETMNYAYERLAEYVLSDREGNADTLDEWADNLQWCIGETSCQKVTLEAYNAKRSKERWVGNLQSPPA